jgi:hypothetical protein
MESILPSYQNTHDASCYLYECFLVSQIRHDRTLNDVGAQYCVLINLQTHAAKMLLLEMPRWHMLKVIS